jgi:hypothetical protein
LSSGGGRKAQKLQPGHTAIFFDPNDAAFTTDMRGIIEGERELGFLAGTKWNHDANGKAHIRKVTHHSAIGKLELHIHERGRPIAGLLSAFDLNRHTVDRSPTF